MGGVVTEEQAIIHAQYIYLVYSDLVTFYDLTPNAPLPTSNPWRPPTEPPINSILGSVQTQSVAKSTKNQNQTTSPTNQATSNPKNASTSIVSTEVNAVQSS